MASRSSRSKSRSASQKSRPAADAGKPPLDPLAPPKGAGDAGSNGTASTNKSSPSPVAAPNAGGKRAERNGRPRGAVLGTSTVAGGAKDAGVAFSQGVPLSMAEEAAREESRFWIIATILLAVGIALRQWQLEAFPYHPDEAIHASFSDGFQTYSYDPIYHGPLLYHLVAAVMYVAGSNDYTARLVPSLLGIGLLALVIGPARKYLGQRGALWSMGLLALSPVMVTYSRRILHDALALLLTLGAVLCFQATREYASSTKRGGLARIGLILAITLFLCTKANVFFIVVMLLAFWITERVAKYWSFPSSAVWRYAPIATLAVVAVAARFTLRDSNATNQPAFAMPESGFKFFCVLGCGVVWLWLFSGPRVQQEVANVPLMRKATSFADDEDDEEDDDEEDNEDDVAEPAPPADRVVEGWQVRTFAAWPYVVGLFAAFWVFVFLYGHGWEWFKSDFPWVKSNLNLQKSISAAFAPGDLTKLHDVMPEDGAITKMLKYWGGQQLTPRLSGPHDYYVVLLALYELPILIVALAGLWRACRERTPFTDLLIWWNVTSFVLYALANEKVPWLMAHQILPMALIGGWWLARTFEEMGQRRMTAPLRAALAGAVALGAVYLLRGVSACNFEAAANKHEPMFYAQDTEAFHDGMVRALKDTEQIPGYEKKGIWVDNGKGPNGEDWANANWPCAWYLREGAYILRGSPVYWDAKANGDTRVAITSTDKWLLVKNQPMFQGWNTKTVEFFVWPRANYPALMPATWFKFWWGRQVNRDKGVNGLLASPGEWSSNNLIIATAPIKK